MGYLADQCTIIRNWFAIGADVYPDTVVTSWIRMAEEALSTVMRVKHMIQIDQSTLTGGRVKLPLDWQEVRLVRLLDTGGVCRYQTPDAFFNSEFPCDPKTPSWQQFKRYCILGNYLMVGDVPADGVQVEMTYYQNIPPLTDSVNNWINIYHPTVYVVKTLHIASMYAIDDDRSTGWAAEADNEVKRLNAAHLIDKASGSVLVQTRRKTFG
jgi:hypothetical protein